MKMITHKTREERVTKGVITPNLLHREERKMTRLKHFAGLGLALLGAALIASRGEAAIVKVCPPNPLVYHTIQAGVNAAAPGDTIVVCSAHYPEQVAISTSNLTLIGQGSPVIEGSGHTGMGLEISNVQGVSVQGFVIENFRDPTGSASGTGVDICAADDVLIDHNVIQGNNYGVSVDNSCGTSSTDVTIQNNTIQNNLWTSPSAWYNGGIAVTAYDSAGANLAVLNNTFANHDRNAVLIGGVNGATVAGNTIKSDGWFAVEFDNTQNVSATGNQIQCAYPITGAVYWPSGGVAAYEYNAPGTMNGTRISNNVVNGYCPIGGHPSIAQGIWLLSYNSTSTIAAPLVTGNSLLKLKGIGVLLLGDGGKSPFSGGTFNGLITTPAVQFNNFSGDALGIDNTTPTTADGVFNFWGCAGGPGNPGCANFSGPVSYTPSLSSAPLP